MSNLRDFVVLDEDCIYSTLVKNAPSAQAAVERSIEEWKLEAEPGYKFYAFPLGNTAAFEFVLGIRVASGWKQPDWAS